MNWVVFHIAGGQAFFTGAGLTIVGAALGLSERKRRFAALAALPGVIFVAVSATPFPYWEYAVAGGVWVCWMAVVRSKTVSEPRRRLACFAVIGVMLIGIGQELPWHFSPKIDWNGDDPIVIYGDSITAGIGEKETTWPKLLDVGKTPKIHDYSRVGATVSSVLKKVREQDAPAGLVILEIGGNDLLGNTTVARFERDLDSLLAELSRHHKQVVMFELPLLPFYNAFGLVQRRLAREYGVVVIPKHVLMGVLAGDGATLDSIHLTADGHRKLADAVSRMFPDRPE